MSVSNVDVVDAATLRDGYAVLSIFHFESWEPLGERIEQLRQKLATYEVFIGQPRFLMHFYAAPIRFELVSMEDPPEQVLEICRDYGVTVVAGESENVDA